MSGSGSAGPYASLHLAPDRQPRQHPTTVKQKLRVKVIIHVVYILFVKFDSVILTCETVDQKIVNGYCSS